MDAAKDIVERLRAGGGRVTRTRRLVIEAILASADHHVTAAEIVDAVRGSDPEFYESTVYRTLDRLVDLGVVERVQLGAGAAVFHLSEAPHHHLVCEHCGSVTEVPANVLEELASSLSHRYGFTIRPSASTLTGACSDCRRPQRRQRARG